MKTTLKNSILSISLFLSINGFTQIYMDQLYGFTYVAVIDEKTQEKISLDFLTEENAEENNVAGVKLHTIWDEEANDSRSYDGDGMARSFTIVVHESCGNCFTLIYNEDDPKDREYFKQDHEMGDFWLQQCTLNSKGEFVPTEVIFYKEIEESKGEVGEGNGDVETYQGDGASVFYGKLDTDEKVYEWGEKPEEGSWVLTPMSESFTGKEVSSTYPPDEDGSYEMEFAFDDDPTTAWFTGEMEDDEDYPNGNYILFSGMVYDETIYILNGYQLSESAFDVNARIKSMEIYVNGDLFGEIILLDQMGAQSISLPGIGKYMSGDGVSIKLVITSVFPGDDYMDAGITEIFSTGG